jgi:hypothetical protein
MMGISLGLKGSTHGDAETDIYSTWDMLMLRCPWAPPSAIEGMEIALAFNRRVVILMSSKVGSLSILGRTGLGNLLMIYSTVRALLGAMLNLFCVCEGRWLLGDDRLKEIN